MHFLLLSNNCHGYYTALTFGLPAAATQGKHRVKRILYSSMSKNVSLRLVIPCWTQHQRFAMLSMPTFGYFASMTEVKSGGVYALKIKGIYRVRLLLLNICSIAFYIVKAHFIEKY